MSRFFILCTFLFTSLFADQEAFPFVGVSTSKHIVDLKSIATEAPNRENNPSSQDETTFGLQYGVQTQNFRTTITAEGTSDFQSIDAQVDYIFMDSLFGTAKIRPYAGGTLGYIRYDEDLITKYNDNSILDNEENDRNATNTIRNKNGYYGLNLGFLFYVTENIDFDISYHYYIMDRLKPLNSMRGGTFALHYFY